jgi:nucleotide-binding universal stress UspA family protein
MFERILVCLDGSKLAEQILPYAEAEAAAFGSKLILLQVVTVDMPSTMYMPPTPPVPESYKQPAEVIQEKTQEEEDKARAYLEGMAKSLQAKGLETEAAVVSGERAGEAIVTYATTGPVDLIAIATHGHSGLGRVVFGSVADHVLRESGLPILVIKPQEVET